MVVVLDSDVRLVVRYRNGVAVGVATLSLRNRAISVARGAELTRLVGEPPRDVTHLIWVDLVKLACLGSTRRFGGAALFLSGSGR